MANAIHEISNIANLAKQLEVEIHRRNLLPGDRFMTAVEAGRALGVSRATADRAMSHLARNQILLRRRSLGTFVGPKSGKVQEENHKVGVVYVCLPDLGPYHHDISPGHIIQGVRKYMPEVNVQFCFYPSHDTLVYFKTVLEPARKANALLGVVAVSCPDEVYQYLFQAKILTVVLGSLYRGGACLPSIDQDNYAAGQLLMEYLLEQGHKRVGLVTVADGRRETMTFSMGLAKFSVTQNCRTMPW